MRTDCFSTIAYSSRMIFVAPLGSVETKCNTLSRSLNKAIIFLFEFIIYGSNTFHRGGKLCCGGGIVTKILLGAVLKQLL